MKKSERCFWIVLLILLSVGRLCSFVGAADDDKYGIEELLLQKEEERERLLPQMEKILLELTSAVEHSEDLKSPLRSVEIAHSYLYNTAFVYLKNEEGEYLIPFSYVAEEVGVENGKLYSVQKIQEKFQNKYNEKEMQENPLSNGGVGTRSLESCRCKC